jgi:hypothetical protein
VTTRSRHQKFSYGNESTHLFHLGVIIFQHNPEHTDAFVQYWHELIKQLRRCRNRRLLFGTIHEQFRLTNPVSKINYEFDPPFS